MHTSIAIEKEISEGVYKEEIEENIEGKPELRIYCESSPERDDLTLCSECGDHSERTD